MRQIDMAFRMYRSDHEERFPDRRDLKSIFTRRVSALGALASIRSTLWVRPALSCPIIRFLKKFGCAQAFKNPPCESGIIRPAHGIHDERSLEWLLDVAL